MPPTSCSRRWTRPCGDSIWSAANRPTSPTRSDSSVTCRATLDETRVASLLLHVIDAREHEREERIEQVNEVLQEIGAEEVPQIQFFNKIDLLPCGAPRIDRDADGTIRRVWVSALNGD